MTDPAWHVHLDVTIGARVTAVRRTIRCDSEFSANRCARELRETIELPDNAGCRMELTDENERVHRRWLYLSRGEWKQS